MLLGRRMNPQIDQLQAKIQTQILQATFLKNMTFLKLKMPAIFQYFQNYQPQKVQLAFDANGYVNVIANNEFVYQGDPKDSSIKQVEAFLDKPPCFDFEVDSKNEASFNYEHEKVIHDIYTKRRETVKDSARYDLKKGGQINFIAFMGSGMGYHIDQLCSQYSIRSMFIFEPEPDVFFATLHCADLNHWFEHCQRLGGELTFKIGGVEEEFVNDINLYFKREGAFNLPQMYLYRHYISDKTTGAFKTINELAYRYKSGWGFCEDEIIGISHSLANVSAKKAHVLLNRAKKSMPQLPVFIIGNGPSLNENIEYIKQNQNNAIVISSGTSLKPLLDNGIKPDMHVEQERPKSIYHWVKKVGHEETLKEIPLLCLNTVYPGILDLFKQPYVVLKGGDAGASFIREYVSEKYAELNFCNPTVTNASTSIAIAMGFQNLFLFGLDYGFKKEGEDHAKGSIYQDIKGYQLASHFKVPASFGGEVHTTRIFDFSRGVLEMLLVEHPEVKCINVSDGAAIKFAEACKMNNLPQFTKIVNKQKMVDNCLNSNFDDSYIISHDLSTDFKALLPTFKTYVSFLCQCLDNVKTKNALTQAFSIQYKFVNDIDNERDKKLFYRFFIGTINYLQASIMSNVARYSNELEQQKFIAFCIQKMREHLLFLVDDLSEHFDKGARV